MYYRIKNQLDAEMLAEEFDSKAAESLVMKRIIEIVETLDSAYGTERKSHDMGGYILYFPDVQTYQKSIGKIEELYCSIRGRKNMHKDTYFGMEKKRYETRGIQNRIPIEYRFLFSSCYICSGTAFEI